MMITMSNYILDLSALNCITSQIQQKRVLQCFTPDTKMRSTAESRCRTEEVLDYTDKTVRVKLW